LKSCAEPAGRAALITGASSGLGYELARLAAFDGFDLVLTARGQPKLQEVADELMTACGVRVHVLTKDLSDDRAAAEIHAATEALGVRISVLINNAGFAQFGPLVDSDVAELLSLLHTNMIALTLLCRLYVPGMVKAKGGMIMNVASTAAFQPGPLMAAYYASKAYVLSLSEALHLELEGLGVTVTALCPGLTRTPFLTRGSMARSGFSSNRWVMDVAPVAAAGYRAMKAGKAVCIPGIWNRVFGFGTRFVSRSIAARAARRVQERRGG